METNAQKQTHRKVLFKLQRDEDGYPPNDWESMWARELGSGLYEMDSIPFFVRGISFHDVVSATERDGELFFDRLIRPSGHSVARVVVPDHRQVAPLRQELARRGCGTEQSHLPGLITVDIPPQANLSEILGFLKEGESAGRWEYEEASLAAG